MFGFGKRKNGDDDKASKKEATMRKVDVVETPSKTNEDFRMAVNVTYKGLKKGSELKEQQLLMKAKLTVIAGWIADNEDYSAVTAEMVSMPLKDWDFSKPK